MTLNVQQGFTTNYLIPSAGQTQHVTYSGALTATPVLLDWRNYAVNNQPFIPQGAFIDNSLGTGDIVVNIQPLNYNVVVKAGVSQAVQFPAPAQCTMSVTGLGQAVLVFVNFPVLPTNPTVNIESFLPGSTLDVVPTPNSNGAPYQTLQSPFTPIGNTQALTVGTTSSGITLGTGTTSARLVNDGAQPIFVNFGGAAVIPVPGTPAPGFCMLPNTVETFTVGGGVAVNAITASGSNTLYITQGQGA